MNKKDRFEIIYQESHGVGLERKCVLVDRETGVTYLFVKSGYAGGLTPLLDAEGKPIIIKEVI